VLLRTTRAAHQSNKTSGGGLTRSILIASAHQAVHIARAAGGSL
jgi:hypothetical protein